MGYVVEKMLLGQVFPEYLRFSLSVSLYQYYIFIFDSAMTGCIQGDVGGKVNIFGGIVSIIVGESSYEHVSNCDWLQ